MRAALALRDLSLLLAMAVVEYTQRWLWGIGEPDRSFGTKFLEFLDATGGPGLVAVSTVVAAEAMIQKFPNGLVLTRMLCEGPSRWIPSIYMRPCQFSYDRGEDRSSSESRSCLFICWKCHSVNYGADH